jgi:hypothetical protein
MNRLARPKDLSSLLLIAVAAIVSLHLVDRLVFAASPLGDSLGLLTLYGETVVIALSLAALRSRVRAGRSATDQKFLSSPRPSAREARSPEPVAEFRAGRPDKSAA